MKATTLLLGLTGALALATPFACGSNDLMNTTYGPPTGAGGFDPTGGSPSGGTITGTANPTTTGGGQGGQGGSVPMCDDSLKRCEHAFTYVGSGSETSVEVRGDWAAPGSWMMGGAMTQSGNTWSATIEVPYNKDVQYKLIVDGNWQTDPANPNTISDGNNNTNSLLTGATCDPFTCAPATGGYTNDAWRDEVMYFVFVDRFVDGSAANNGSPTPNVQKPADYQGGDYAGVTSKINAGYFNSLGVTLLWLTVPMDNTEESGTATDPNDSHLYSAYHGYWPKNLDKSEEHFGTMAELKALVDAAHGKGLKVILDYAMNHVHKSSPVFTDHPGWFWPNQNPNNASQDCICGHGCSWDAESERERCWFTSYLPDFNFKNEDARNFSVDNAIWWAKQTGADGYRLDAMKHIDISWLYSMRARAISDLESERPDTHIYMVGETFTGDRNLIKKYVDPAQLLDGQFDFPLRDQILNAVLKKSEKMSDLKNFIDDNDNFYGPTAIMSTFIGNHDVARVINYAANPGYNSNDTWSNLPGLPSGTDAFERLAVAFGVLFTNKGIPLVYYGDEVGLPGGSDPDNRRPMQWSGYSQGQQLLLDRLKKLGAARAAHESLRRGSRSTLTANDDVWAFKMTTANDTVCVVLNRSDSGQQVGNLGGCPTKDAVTGGTFSGPTINAPARSVLILTQ